MARVWPWLASPVTLVFSILAFMRRVAYRLNLKKQSKFSVPVVVVGNITVGGTGKTPMVIALVNRLRDAGWKPGIVSRGYGGEALSYPLLVTGETPVTQSGDEPAMIARHTSCPVMVDPQRSRAVQMLANNYDVDIVVSDDGLQHYAMSRNAEVVVVDAARGYGNGWLLPSGPLREGKWRLENVNAVLVNGGDDSNASFQLEQSDAVNLLDGSELPLRAFSGQSGHAVAGIGNPGRFFQQLGDAGVKFESHTFPDHYNYMSSDLNFSGAKWVLMTEKDAVKCKAFANEKLWYVPVNAKFNSMAESVMTELLLTLESFRN